MNRRIYLITDREQLVAMHETPYESEGLLQQLLAQYPGLLAGDASPGDDAERRWLLVRREMRIPGELDGASRWSLDHLFIDNDGVPTLVEVKRSTDTRIRREVVGQMLDYAANAVVHWPVERLRSQFEARCEQDDLDPEQELAGVIGPVGDDAAFWTAVKTNLQAGRVRLVFVADVIPPELRRVIEFLNEQMDPAEVIALEISQFIGEGLRTLVPRVLGQTEAAKQRKGTDGAVRESITESEFYAAFDAAHDEHVRQAARTIQRHMKSLGMESTFARGSRVQSLIPVLTVGDRKYFPLSVRKERIVLQGRWLAGVAPFDTDAGQAELLAHLMAVPGVKMKGAGLSGFPEVPWSALLEPATLEAFLGFMSWLALTLRNADVSPTS